MARCDSLGAPGGRSDAPLGMLVVSIAPQQNDAPIGAEDALGQLLPDGPEIIDQRNDNLTVGCLSCHRAHASDNRVLAHGNPDDELCTMCHEEYVR